MTWHDELAWHASVAHIQETQAVTEHEPAAGWPVAPQDSISPFLTTTGSFAAVPNEPVPDFALDRPRAGQQTNTENKRRP